MLFFWNALSFLAWDPLEYKDHGRSVSTHRQTVSTPLASTILTASWDSHLVSTHRWTVSTPLEYIFLYYLMKL
ncbi:hypothetical protein Taro_050402 [Colocasia esculenta]|uniref:Uncharacterized protein n=1 Tax=Colocasia esculenta TaxID=4460 RepID=A0A843XDR8_COLES|nr:hypothetical protein [Colocasia esculenta]